MSETTTEASLTSEAARVSALAGAADAARGAIETPAGGAPGETAPGVEAGELQIKLEQVARASTFVTKIVAKTGNRFLPGLFDDDDKAELAQLLQPVMLKHETVILTWIEKWFDEAMLGVFLVDKVGDAIELVRQRIEDKKQHGKAAQKNPSENSAAPTNGFVTVDPNPPPVPV